MTHIKRNIENKLNSPGIIEKIASGLSNSELNSFLLELFREQSKKVKPSDLLKQFEQNRFLVPSPLDMIGFKEYEIEWLRDAQNYGFIPIHLSPLAPLGSCSAIGYVDQNNIVSAARGTEVVSDATNVLALKAASDFRSDKSKRIIKYCTTHRHTRAQSFTNPDFSAHFGLFCMVTGGFDSGSYKFEREQINNHLQFYLRKLLKEFQNDFILKISFKTDRDDFKERMYADLIEVAERIKTIYNVSDGTNDYYETIRIKIFMSHESKEIDIADMGFVNWTQKLLNNKKQRLLISGCGLELLYKIHSRLTGRLEAVGRKK